MNRELLAALPKVELHLHLEGAIPPTDLWPLLAKYGGDPAVPTPEAIAERLRFRTFREFLQGWNWKNGFLREYEDFTWIAEAVARDLARQRIVYAEVFCSPPDFALAHGLKTQPFLAAVRAGLDRVPEVEVALVVDLVRDYGAERAMRTLHETDEAREFGVIGVGIGGSEHRYPPDLYTEVYHEARRLGFYTSAHAGEAAGPESMWGAVRSLAVDRIGHGTRAEEDDALLEHLLVARTPLEMCPLSNVRTGTVESIERHPIRRYFDRGLLVTVNTDDPGMFGNSLVEEFDLLAGQFGFEDREILQLMRNAIDASWADEDRKVELHARLAAAIREA